MASGKVVGRKRDYSILAGRKSVIVKLDRWREAQRSTGFASPEWHALRRDIPESRNAPTGTQCVVQLAKRLAAADTVGEGLVPDKGTRCLVKWSKRRQCNIVAQQVCEMEV